MNTAVGTRALSGLYYASGNTAVGYQALYNLGGMGSYGNTAVGNNAGPLGMGVNTTSIGDMQRQRRTIKYVLVMQK